MIVRELTTRLGFQANTAQARSYADAIRTVRRVALATTAAVAALSGASIGLAKSLARSGNETAKSAVEAGLAVEKYQELRFVLGQISQVSANELDRALGNTNIRIQRAAVEGGTLADTLQDIGFASERVRDGSIGTEEAFNRISELARDSETSALAATAAYQLFGDRVARRLVPALQRGSTDIAALREEARQLGLGFSEEALDASERLTDSFGRLSLVGETVRGILAEELLPAVADIVDAITDWFSANREIIEQNLARFFQVFAFNIQILASLVTNLISGINNIAEAFGGWERSTRLALSAILLLIAVPLTKFIIGVGLALRGVTAAVFSLRFALLTLSRIPIVAAFSALILVIEDLIVFLLGGNSAIGRFIDKLDDFKAKVTEVADSVGIDLGVMGRQLKGLGEIILGTLTFDGELILNGIRNLWEPMRDAGIELGRRLRSGFIDGVGGFLTDLLLGEELASGDRRPGEQYYEGLQMLDQSTGAGSPPALQSPYMSMRRDLNINTDVTLQVPAGTTEQQQAAVRQQAEAVFSREWDRLVRQSMWDFQPQE